MKLEGTAKQPFIQDGTYPEFNSIRNIAKQTDLANILNSFPGLGYKSIEFNLPERNVKLVEPIPLKGDPKYDLEFDPAANELKDYEYRDRDNPFLVTAEHTSSTDAYIKLLQGVLSLVPGEMR